MSYKPTQELGTCSPQQYISALLATIDKKDSRRDNVNENMDDLAILEETESNALQCLIEIATEDLNYPDVKEFVVEALKTHGTVYQLADAFKIKDCLMAMMDK